MLFQFQVIQSQSIYLNQKKVYYNSTRYLTGPNGKNNSQNLLGNLEKEMATYFSILAWKIPWTEKLGGLQSMGLQRVGHDWLRSSCAVLSRVWFSERPWTVAWQAPLSTGFSRQEYWSGVPFPSPGDFSNPGIKLLYVSCIGKWVLYH